MEKKKATLTVKKRKKYPDNYQLSFVQGDVDFLGIDESRKVLKVYDEVNKQIIIKAYTEE